MTPEEKPQAQLGDFSREYLLSRIAGRHTVDIETGCWNWTMSLGNNGYGKAHLKSRDLRLYSVAHKVSYFIHRGPVPDGLQLDHLCRNRRCINPDHLEPVTQAENLRRAAVAHSFDDQYCTCRRHGRADGYVGSSKNYPRLVCRICARERYKRWNDRRKAS